MSHDSLEGLVNESASVWSLVDSIEQHIRRQLASHIYPLATDNFFGYIMRLATGTKNLIAAGLENSMDSPTVKRARLATLKGCWRLLHELVRPAGDAHTLAAPTALIELAADQLRRIPGLDQAQVVVSLSPRLMYHQTKHTGISNLATKIAQIIPGEPFPRQLGFVALPFSQGAGFFTNLLLYHELGHFVFEELSSYNSDPRIGKLDSKLVAAIEHATADRPALASTVRAFALATLRNWTQEIFCDAFALNIVGPAFSFAFVDMLSLLDLLDDHQIVAFTPSHPAPACRYSAHLHVLRSAGWWSVLEDVQVPQKKLIERLAARDKEDYRLVLDGKMDKDAVLIPAFLKILPDILDVTRDIIAPAAAAAEDFAAGRKHIEKCLLNGIVPSVSPDDQSIPPNPVSVINTAFTFYLTSLDELMERLGKKPLDVKERSYWTNRLESWTQKALEDIQLLSRSTRARSDERSIKG